MTAGSRLICVAVSGAGAWISQAVGLGCRWYLLTAYSVTSVFGAEVPLGSGAGRGGCGECDDGTFGAVVVDGP
jgi:hypothetical protein